jgi:putative transposase
LDEVYLKISGKCQWLRHAVDQVGQVLDILVQPKRDKAVAERFLKKVLRFTRQAPRQMFTDRLASYTQPCAEHLPNASPIRDKGVNNRELMNRSLGIWSDIDQVD